MGADVEKAAGPLQVCVVQDGGYEAAVHTMHLYPKTLKSKRSYCIVDANSAFNLINQNFAFYGVWVQKVGVAI